MIIVDKENFEAEVLKSDLPVIVDLWGPQCGPCLALMPSVEKLAEEYEGKIKFCKPKTAVWSSPSRLWPCPPSCSTRAGKTCSG